MTTIRRACVLSLLSSALLQGAHAQPASLPATEPTQDLAQDLIASKKLRLNIARSEGHTVTRLRDGRLLVLGGSSDHAATAAAELIDPISGRVELLSNMLQARRGHSATLLADGRVLIAGGDLADGRVLALNSAEIFDPRTRTFSAVAAPMSIERARHTATLLKNGQVLITGGQGLRAGMVAFSAELFDPGTGSFEMLTPQRLVAPRVYHAATLLDSGQVLIVGGTDWQTPRAHSSAELYDPESKSFTPLTATLSTRNEMPTTLKLRGGRVLVLGNQGADLYDPLSQSFTALPGPLKPRSYAAASALSDGGAVLLGGISGTDLTASVERFSAARGSFRPAGQLPKERAFGVAALSDTGAVLVIGGVDRADAPISEIAVFKP